MIERKLRVAMIAPPWLKIPVNGYGGVEEVIDALVESLQDAGVEVEIFGVGGRRLHGAKVHAITKDEQFEHILKPMYDFALPIPAHHVLASLSAIQADGNFDIIHDHNYFIGPSVLSWASKLGDVPPVIHTIHGPPLSTERSLADGFPDNRPFWRSVAGDHHCYFVPISNAMKRTLPRQLSDNVLDTVHNAIELHNFPFVDREKRKNYFVTFARVAEEKGQHIAVKIAAKHRYRLRMAGPVATIDTNRKLMLELANPLSKYRNDRDFKYYSDKILPYLLRSPRITYAGTMGGKKKLTFLSQAKALLFPITWDEPFGMAVIEALACGTPVVAMNRGAMSEIIEHGVNGFLADTEEEFEQYMARVDEINPAACRESVERKFSAETMAEAYLARYLEVIERKNASVGRISSRTVSAKK